MTTYYEERMEADLDEVRTKLRKVSDLVESQVARALTALFEDDRALASEVVLGDRQVNRRIKQIDSLCHAFIVRHAPTEDFLRRVSAVLRLDVALERVGDYADSIAREAGRIEGPLSEEVVGQIGMLAEEARQSLSVAIGAFHDGDVEAARSSLGSDDRVATKLEGIINTLLDAGEHGGNDLEDVFGLLHVMNLLMRVIEQAENIREQTLFAELGETSAPRVFRVHFFDAGNDRASQLAEAYARREFPGSGRYSSGAWSPAQGIEADVVDFLERQGIDASSSKPKPATTQDETGEHYHVVVSMTSDGRGRLESVPYRTTLLVWDVDETSRDASLDALYEDVGTRVRDLMHTLAGPEAA